MLTTEADVIWPLVVGFLMTAYSGRTLCSLQFLLGSTESSTVRSSPTILAPATWGALWYICISHLDRKGVIF